MSFNKLEFTSTHSKNNIDKIIEECEIYRKDLIRYCLQHFEFEYEYAEDCVQEAYAALYENLSRGIEIKNYKAWLYKVAMNYKNKAIKDKVKRDEFSFLTNEDKDKTLENTVSYNPDYLENLVSDYEIERRYIEIISSLSKEEKNLYINHYLKKKTFTEIGLEFGIKASTVERRHAKLKKKIIKMARNIDK